MDNKTQPGTPDSKAINLSQEHEVSYWTKKLKVSKDELIAAVNAVGKSVEAVREYLNTKELEAKYPPLT